MEMERTILTQTTKVIFNKEQYNKDVPYYIVLITVITKKYDNDTISFYDINYDYEFNLANEDKKNEAYYRKIMHPYYIRGGDHFGNPQYGREILKNDVTEAMVKFLLMDDDDLSNHSGTNNPQKYRINIMLALSYF